MISTGDMSSFDMIWNLLTLDRSSRSTASSAGLSLRTSCSSGRKMTKILGGSRGFFPSLRRLGLPLGRLSPDDWPRTGSAGTERWLREQRVSDKPVGSATANRRGRPKQFRAKANLMEVKVMG